MKEGEAPAIDSIPFYNGRAHSRSSPDSAPLHERYVVWSSKLAVFQLGAYEPTHTALKL